MKTNRILLGLAALTLAACHRTPITKSRSCCAKENAATTATKFMPEAAGGSVYQLTGSWTDQHDRLLTLSKLQGHPQVVAMIFTHCLSVCPRIVEEMKAIRDSLPASVKEKVGGVLVSFDPERDTPAQMRMFAMKRQLDDHWELLQGSDNQVRELSMVLNVRYQKLSGGNFTHSSDIFILDQNGNIIQSLDGLGRNIHRADSILNRMATKD
jgi:protein SCO1/2